MKILPAVSRGIAWLDDDGEPHSVPFQVFMTEGGMTVVRVGHNTLWFDKNGAFDGTEHSIEGLDADDGGSDAVGTAQVLEDLDRRQQERVLEIKPLLDASKKNLGHAPEQPYFCPGSVGYEREIAGWPIAERPVHQDEPSRERERRFVSILSDDSNPSDPSKVRH